MSADNYLYVRRNGEVWMAFASEDRPPWESGGNPMHIGTDFYDALEWAFVETNRGYYEYGVDAEPKP